LFHREPQKHTQRKVGMKAGFTAVSKSLFHLGKSRP
jgi:hypothetical protein